MRIYLNILYLISVQLYPRAISSRDFNPRSDCRKRCSSSAEVTLPLAVAPPPPLGLSTLARISMARCLRATLAGSSSASSEESESEDIICRGKILRKSRQKSGKKKSRRAVGRRSSSFRRLRTIRGTTDISWTSSTRSDEWLEPEMAPYRLLDLDAISKLEIFSR